MPESAGPRDVFERLLRGITAGAWERLPDLYAEEAVVEFPFTAPAPARLAGRGQIRDHFSAAAGAPLEFEARNVVVHDTGDPEVIIAEFDYDGRVTATGRPFQVSNIQVLRVRDGQIVASRDYHDHPAIADAIGRSPELEEST
ncbi:MAG: ketosteroid isomerase [Streptosporangiales bacterium]|nr:ketosteroid isomerase [Streptosporangiales bacterium]